MWGPTIPELKAALPSARIIDRSKVNAWDEPRIPEMVATTGRTKLIMAGVSTEVCVAFPAISATAAGYDVYAAVDASGTFSMTKRTTGILRMLQAGVIVTDYASIAVEVLNDNAAAKAAQLYAALDLPYAALVGQLSAALARPAA
jgi:nicotinamidase-related amidase